MGEAMNSPLTIILQGLFIALVFFLAAWLPWLPVRLYFLLAGLCIVYLFLRNPNLIFRRMFQVLVLAAVAPLGFNARAGGTVLLPDQSGLVHFLVQLGNNTPTWLWLGLAALALAGDLYLVSRGDQKRQGLFNAHFRQGQVVETTEAAVIKVTTSLTPSTAVNLRGATLRIVRILPLDLPCDLFVKISPLAPGDDITADAPRDVPIPAGQSAEIVVKRIVPKDSGGRYLLRRAGTTLFGLAPLKAVVNFDATPKLEALPVVLTRSN